MRKQKLICLLGWCLGSGLLLAQDVDFVGPHPVLPEPSPSTSEGQSLRVRPAEEGAHRVQADQPRGRLWIRNGGWVRSDADTESDKRASRNPFGPLSSTTSDSLGAALGVQGIVMGLKPTAVVNGEMVHVGSQIAGARVEVIDAEGVDFSWQAQSFSVHQGDTIRLPSARL